MDWEEKDRKKGREKKRKIEMANKGLSKSGQEACREVEQARYVSELLQVTDKYSAHQEIRFG